MTSQNRTSQNSNVQLHRFGMLLVYLTSAMALAPQANSEPLSSPQPRQATQTLLRQQGTLADGDSVLASDGSLYDEYTFEGTTGQQVTISLVSSDFDTYLILLGPDGTVIDQNDDISSSNFNSELTVTLPVAGTYTVIANSYDNSGRGRYTLTVTAGRVATTPPSTEPQSCPSSFGAGFYARITTDGDDLRVRATPNGQIIGAIPNGWEVIVQERNAAGTWARVISHFGEGFGNGTDAFGTAPNFRNGWVSTDYLTDLGYFCEKPFNLRSLIQPGLFGQRDVVVNEDWIARGDRLAQVVQGQPVHSQSAKLP
jgi:hypothetical protein